MVRELTPNPHFVKSNMTFERAFLSRFSVSGLFVVCVLPEPEFLPLDWSVQDCHTLLKPRLKCLPLFDDDYSPDPNDSTNAVPFAITRCRLVLVVAGLLLVGGLLLSIQTNCPCKTRPVLSLVAGVLFILQSLASTTCLVCLVSNFKSEVAIKTRKTSEFMPEVLRYRYSDGVLFLVCSLLLAKVAGTLAILFYIRSYSKNEPWKVEANEMHETLEPPVVVIEEPIMLDPNHLVVQSRGRRWSRTLGIENDTLPPPPPPPKQFRRENETQSH